MTKSEDFTSCQCRQTISGQNLQCVQDFRTTIPKVPSPATRARALLVSRTTKCSAPAFAAPPMSKTTWWPCSAVLFRIVGTLTIPGEPPLGPSANPMIFKNYQPSKAIEQAPTMISISRDQRSLLLTTNSIRSRPGPQSLAFRSRSVEPRCS